MYYFILRDGSGCDLPYELVRIPAPGASGRYADERVVGRFEDRAEADLACDALNAEATSDRGMAAMILAGVLVSAVVCVGAIGGFLDRAHPESGPALPVWVTAAAGLAGLVYLAAACLLAVGCGYILVTRWGAARPDGDVPAGVGTSRP